MARTCSVCAHPARLEIDADSASSRKLSAQYGVSEQAIRRHRAAHLPGSASAQRASGPDVELAHLQEMLAIERRHHDDLLARLVAAEATQAELLTRLATADTAQAELRRLVAQANGKTLALEATSRSIEHNIEPSIGRPRFGWRPWRRSPTAEGG